MKNSPQKTIGAPIKSGYNEKERTLRSLYLEHPDRKQFFSYDFAEALWMRMFDCYGKTIGDDAIEEMTCSLLRDDRIWEMVYDVTQKYADERGWEMI